MLALPRAYVWVASTADGDIDRYRIQADGAQLHFTRLTTPTAFNLISYAA